MRVYFLAVNTLKELLFERVFHLVILLACSLFGLSFLFGALSFLEQQKILADFGFLAMELSCLVASLFFGSYTLAREIEKQTCLLVLSRPISRAQFVLAKFLGIAFLNAMIVVALSLVLALLLWLAQAPITFLPLISLSIFLKMCVVLGVALAASTLVRPVLSLLFGFAVYLLAHWIPDLQYFAKKSGDAFAQNILKGLEWVVPQFYRMNWKSFFFLEKGPGSLEVIWMFMHSLGWILFLSVVAQFFFRRKDIV